MPTNLWTDQEVLVLIGIVHMCQSFHGELTWEELSEELGKRLQKHDSESGKKSERRKYNGASVRSKVVDLVHKGVLPAQSAVQREIRKGKNAQEMILAYAHAKGYRVAKIRNERAPEVELVPDVDEDGGQIEMEMEMGMGSAEGMGMGRRQSLPSPRHTYSPAGSRPQGLAAPSSTSETPAGGRSGPGMSGLMMDVSQLSMGGPSRHSPPNRFPEPRRHGSIHQFETLVAVAESTLKNIDGSDTLVGDPARAQEQRQGHQSGLHALANAATSDRSRHISAPTRARLADVQNRRNVKNIRRQAEQQHAPNGQANPHSSSSSTPGHRLPYPVPARKTSPRTGGRHQHRRPIFDPRNPNTQLPLPQTYQPHMPNPLPPVQHPDQTPPIQTPINHHNSDAVDAVSQS